MSESNGCAGVDRVKVTVYSKVEQVPRNIWSRCGERGALFCSADWFQLAENTGVNICYLVSSETTSGESLGVLPVLLDSPRQGGTYDLASHLVQKSLKDGFDPKKWSPALVAGSWNSNLAIAPYFIVSQGSSIRNLHLKALLGELERMAERLFRPCVSIPFLTTESVQEIAEVVGERGMFFRTKPNTAWENPGLQSFDEYLGSTGHRRNKILREMKEFRNTYGEVQIVPMREIVDEVVDLVLQNKVRHGAFGDREGIRGILLSQAEVFGDRMISFCAYRDGKLFGVVNTIESHGGLYARTFGVNYEVGTTNMEYFNLTYYEPMSYCIDHGLKWLHAGPEAFEAKIRRGLELMPLWTFFLPTATPTQEQILAMHQWNREELQKWQRWFYSKTNRPLPPNWQYPRFEQMERDASLSLQIFRKDS